MRMKPWVQAAWELGHNWAPGGREGARGPGINLNNGGREGQEREQDGFEGNC